MTKQLHKIILIQSADIAYTEMEIFGNTHFVGTNGFGKTTALRTILYFYNPTSEKRELDIREDQAKFIDYYLKYENSYIIYEVCRGELPSGEADFYHILLRNKGNRVCYNFIDAPYDQSIYIDSEANIYNFGEIENQWNKRKIYYTPEISGYKEYKDIIYGGHKDKKYQLYKIFTTRANQQFHIIAKIISNIFVSSKLDSSQIKDSIIQAVLDNREKNSIDLKHIANRLKDFSRFIMDYETFQKNIKQAEAIIANYEQILILHELLHNNAPIIGNAYRNLKAKIKDWQALIEKLNTDLENAKKERENKIIELNHQRDNWKKREAINDKDLKDLEGNRWYYYTQTFAEYWEKQEQIKKTIDLPESIQNIENQAFIKTIQKFTPDYRDILNNKWKENEERLRILTSRQQHIETEFQKRKAELASHKAKFELSIQTKIQVIEQQKGLKINELKDDLDKQKNDILSEQEKKLTAEKDLLANQKRGLDLAKHQLKTIENQIFLKPEIEETQSQIHQLEKNIKQLNHENELKEKDIKNNQNLYEIELEKNQQKFVTQRDKLQDQDNILKKEIESLKQLINQYEDSFQKYLNDNQPDWEQTFGKVCKTSLLNAPTALLNPQLITQNANLFGVDLDLTQIISEVQNLNDLETEQAKKTRERDKIKIEFQQIIDNQQLEEEKLREKYTKPNKVFQKEIERNKLTNEQNIKNLAIQRQKLENLKNQAQVEKKQAITQKNEEIDRLGNKINLQNQKIKTLIDSHQNEIEQWRQNRQAKIQAIENQANEEIQPLELQKEQNEANYQQSLKNIEQDRKQKLESQGIDSDLVTELEDENDHYQNEIRFIDFITGTPAIQYISTKENYFDKEPEFIQEKDIIAKGLIQVEQQIQTIQEEYEKNIFAELNKQIQKTQKLVGNAENEVDDFENGFKEKSVYYAYQNIIENSQLTDNEVISLKELSRNMEIDYDKLSKQKSDIRKDLSEYVGKFLNYQGSFHQFHNHSLKTDDDYLNFVKSILQPFLSEDKISTTHNQLVRQQGDLLNLIAKQYSDINSNSSEIDKKVRKINQDLENTNFLKVVKEIRIRTVNKGSNLLNVIKRVESFNEANYFQQGALFDNMAENKPKIDKKATELLSDVAREIENSLKDGENELGVKNVFDLEFKIVENNNDTGWKNSLKAIGSTGTDILVKSIIYITLLNVFKEEKFKNEDYLLHCVLDEAGQISDQYWQEVINFARPKGIGIILASPNENDPTIYDRVYQVRRDVITSKVQIIKLLWKN